MTYRWSEGAAHILSLFAPWSEGDGFEESVVRNVEENLGLRFPLRLRNFYLFWGKRKDITRSNQIFLEPDETFIHHNHLVICIENQAVEYFGIPIDRLSEGNPPVDWIYNDEDTEWKPSHKQLTTFMDSLFYHHAFCGGAVHSAFVRIYENHERIENMIELNYQRISLDCIPWYIHPGEDYSPWLLYTHPGLVIDPFWGVSAVASTLEALQELENKIEIKWDKIS